MNSREEGGGKTGRLEPGAAVTEWRREGSREDVDGFADDVIDEQSVDPRPSRDVKPDNGKDRGAGGDWPPADLPTSAKRRTAASGRCGTEGRRKQRANVDGARGEARGPLRPTAPTEPRREEPGAGFQWRRAVARPLSVGWVGRARTGRGCTVATALHPCSGLLISVAERATPGGRSDTTSRRPQLSLPTAPDPR